MADSLESDLELKKKVVLYYHELVRGTWNRLTTLVLSFHVTLVRSDAAIKLSTTLSQTIYWAERTDTKIPHTRLRLWFSKRISWTGLENWPGERKSKVRLKQGWKFAWSWRGAWTRFRCGKWWSERAKRENWKASEAIVRCKVASVTHFVFRLNPVLA